MVYRGLDSWFAVLHLQILVQVPLYKTGESSWLPDRYNKNQTNNRKRVSPDRDISRDLLRAFGTETSIAKAFHSAMTCIV